MKDRLPISRVGYLDPILLVEQHYKLQCVYGVKPWTAITEQRCLYIYICRGNLQIECFYDLMLQVLYK